jgi:hypothetical protein
VKTPDFANNPHSGEPALCRRYSSGYRNRDSHFLIWGHPEVPAFSPAGRGIWRAGGSRRQIRIGIWWDASFPRSVCRHSFLKNSHSTSDRRVVQDTGPDYQAGKSVLSTTTGSLHIAPGRARNAEKVSLRNSTWCAMSG